MTFSVVLSKEAMEAKMRRYIPLALGFALSLFAGAVYASDVTCCKACCKTEKCIMTHGRAHDCLNHPPCK